MFGRDVWEKLMGCRIRRSASGSVSRRRRAGGDKLALKALEDRMLLSANTVTFDFEDQAATSKPESGAYATLSMTKSGVTLEISRPGSRFDVVANTAEQFKPAPFGARGLDPFSDCSNARFIFNFSVPVNDVSLLMEVVVGNV